MPALARRLTLLLFASPDQGSVAAVLAGAIPHADPAELATICRAALATGQPAAIAAVLRHADRLGPKGREILARMETGANGEPLSRAVAGIVAEGEAGAVLNAVALIRRRREPVLAPHLVAALRSAEPDVAVAAAEALLDLTVAAAGRGGRRVGGEPGARRIDRAVAAAARRYRAHRQPAVLLAAAILSNRPGRELQRLLEERGDPFGGTLRGVVACVDQPLVRRNLLRWLGSDVLARSAARWLHLIEGEEAFAETLEDGHLLLVPGRRTALRQANRPLQCVPPPSIAARLSQRSQAQVPLVVDRLALSSRARIEHLAALTTLASPVARMKAVAALAARNGDRALAAMERYGHDPDPAVSRLAFDEFLRRLTQPPTPRKGQARSSSTTATNEATKGQALLSSPGDVPVLSPPAPPGEVPVLSSPSSAPPAGEVPVLSSEVGLGPAIIARFERSPHPGVARRATGHLVRGSVDALLGRWRRLPGDHRRAAALALLARDRQPLLARLTDLLRNPRPSRSGPRPIELIQLVRRLRLVADLEPILLTLTASADPRVASAAIIALAGGSDPRRLGVLAEALRHDDARVRANAVEALGRARVDDARVRQGIVRAITPLARSPHNRVRANAVRVRIDSDPPDATDDVRAMLSDPSPLHRVSGIWVARVTRSMWAADDLNRLAGADPASEIRVRARTALRFLEAAGAGEAADGVAVPC